MKKMNYTEGLIPALVDTELREANKKHPPFHSLHEGYAVLLEELEETKEALNMVDFRIGQMWGFIRADLDFTAERTAAALKAEAIHLAAEAIQVAAMAEKMQAIGEESPENNPDEAEPGRHGKWIDGRPYTNSRWKVCSACHVSAPNPEGGGRYCPNCGAKMDLEEE